MRRHTTKQPRGAATTARPSPASRARIRNGSPTSGPLTQRALARGRCLRFACQIVAVIVVVVVERESARRLRPEQPRVLGVLRHRLGYARAAYVPVETYDTVALRHYD